MEVPRIARELRVSGNSVYQWRRAWKAGGRGALRSKGSSGYDCRLPGAHADRTQAPSLLQRLRVSGVTLLLHRMGYSVQMPACPAAERDEDAITVWREMTWQEVKPSGRRRRVHLFRGRSGRDRPSAQGRTGGRRGITPSVTVSGRSRGRLSVAGLLCYRPSAPSASWRLCSASGSRRCGTDTASSADSSPGRASHSTDRTDPDTARLVNTKLRSRALVPAGRVGPGGDFSQPAMLVGAVAVSRCMMWPVAVNASLPTSGPVRVSVTVNPSPA